ncbi:MAG TPA: TIR domain-containing protein [Longimicrobiaceae bacterium]|jgi:hypothetical protein
MGEKKRASMFVGSSAEGLQIARAIQVGLDYDCEVTLWNQGVFGLGEGTLETLVKLLDRFDFAILVLTPDDLIKSRGESTQAPRDNVLFELGLFMGGIGRDRTFVVHDRTAQLRLPSDLAGVTTATFAPRSDGNLVAALGAVTSRIASVINQLGPRAIPTHQLTTARRVIGVPPRITVTGGRDSASNAKAFEVAYELGRRIAERDVRLLSGVADGVDESFCRGVADLFAAEGGDVKRMLTCFTNKGTHPRHRFGRILESRYRSRLDGIPELVSDADILVTLGGGRNTHHLGVLALLEDRVLLPIASTGGASGDLYSLVAPRFDTVFAGRLDRDLFDDLADLNNSAVQIADACLRAIDALSRNG